MKVSLNLEELLADLQNLVYIYQYEISESLKPSQCLWEMYSNSHTVQQNMGVVSIIVPSFILACKAYDFGSSSP